MGDRRQPTPPPVNQVKTCTTTGATGEGTSGETPNADVIRAAMMWWLSKRPAVWTLRQHQATPAVNCQSQAEIDLAEAVGKWSMVYF